MRVLRRTILSSIALVGVACGGGEPSWTGTITDSAGVTIVANPVEGVWTEADRWTVEEELRIGVVEGDPEYQFGDVGGIAVDSRGRIFVLDVQAQHIKVFSPQGEYERTLGGRGKGLGELHTAYFIMMGPGDTLLVPDRGNLRINRYAADGSSLGSFRLSPEHGYPMQGRATSRGVMAQQVRPIPMLAQEAAESLRDVLLTLKPDGTVTDTLMTFPSGKSLTLDGNVHMYAPEPVWDVTDDLQVVLGVNDEYRIGVYRDGQARLIITRPFRREPISDRDRATIRGLLERAWLASGVPADAVPRLQSVFHFAEFYPAFQSLAVGPAGSIWVQRVAPASKRSGEEFVSFNVTGPAMGAGEWDVFDAAGWFLGVVTMPPDFAPMLFVHDQIYGIWRDELDVQYVVRLRLVGELGVGAT